MNEDALNMSVRKFLKTIGVTAQREIEKAVRSAEENGSLPDSPLTAQASITVAGVELEVIVNGKIETR
ncbi:MAG: hypothetical protein IPM60_05465 [Rhodospirillales bacterium]|nr:hypothetical protein [Rhodospirillales bacterium]